MPRRLVVIVVLLFQAAATSDAQTTQAIRTGTSDIVFTQSSPLSTVKMQHARYGLEGSPEDEYDIAHERFSLVVPETYDPESLEWGVLVWCNAGRNAALPKDWEMPLAKKKLIAIAAYNVGNDRGVAIRVGLSLDAAFNLRQRYPSLNEHRVYVSGISGGAKVASMAAMAFPEIFDGAICCAGVNWYKDTPVPDQPNKAWPATFRRPPLPMFNDAKENVGFVLVTGVKDPNYLPMKTMYEHGFLPEEFKHVTLFDVPDLGHQTPPGEWFEKAVDFLDAIPKKREKKLPSATTTAPAGARLAATTLPADILKPATASAASPEPSAAARLLALAKNYRVNKMPDKARAKLEQLLKEYPDSEEAKVARTMLEQLKSQASAPRP
jgi:hypothetical protein